MPTESNDDYLGDSFKDMATSSRPSSQSSDHEGGINDQEIFYCPESDLEIVNTSLSLIGVSPLNKRRALSTASYLPKKKQKIHDAVSEKIESVCGSTYSEASGDTVEDLKADEIIASLIERYKNSDSRPEKMTILTIFAPSWTRQKMAEKLGCSHRMAVQAKRLALEKGILANQESKHGRSLAAEITECVQSFYYREDISRLMPGKKDCIRVIKKNEKVTVQKRLVLCSLKESFIKFRDSFPEMKIGFSKFASLRPKECKLAGASGTHSVCVCTIHNNLKLMMVGSMMNKVTAHLDVPLEHYSHAIASITCNPAQPSCYLGECNYCPDVESLRTQLTQCFEEAQVDTVEFKQWTTTDRSTLETKVQTTDDFLEQFLSKLQLLKRHDFVAKQQTQYLQSRKESLVAGEFLVIGDFSENFSFVVQDAAQAFHWNNNMATIHPFVYYYNAQGSLSHGNFVLISDCNVHDTIAVHLFQQRLVAHLKGKFSTVGKIIYFSDGCAGQYKNLKYFTNLCLHEQDFGIGAEWHFFATSHGKGPSDGIGGTIKREATRASLQRPYQDQILTPSQLHNFVSTNLTGVVSEFVTCEDYAAECKTLANRFKLAKTIAGTQKLHSFVVVSDTTLSVLEYSLSSTHMEVSITKSTLQPSHITAGYVAVIYDDKWWVAYINEAYPERNEISANFLHPNGPNSSYVYPRHPDIIIMDVSDVMIQLHPTTRTGRTYYLPEEETHKTVEAFAFRTK